MFCVAFMGRRLCCGVMWNMDPHEISSPLPLCCFGTGVARTSQISQQEVTSMLSIRRLLVLCGFGGVLPPFLFVGCSGALGHKQGLAAITPSSLSLPPSQTQASSFRLEGLVIEQVGTASWYGPRFQGRKTA